MRRLVYVLTVALFFAGLIVPAVSYAGDDGRLKISTHNARIERADASIHDAPVSRSEEAGRTWNAVFSGLFRLLDSTANSVFVHVHAVIAKDRVAEPDRPLFVHRPDWWRPPGPSDRPDMDDGGWDEQIK